MTNRGRGNPTCFPAESYIRSDWKGNREPSWVHPFDVAFAVALAQCRSLWQLRFQVFPQAKGQRL